MVAAKGMLLAAAAVIWVAAVGCDLTRKRGDVAIDFSQFAELPGARASHNAKLQAELARIVDERATPKLMMEYRTAASGNKSELRPHLADDENAATEFASLFDPIELKSVRARLERLYPTTQFAFTADAHVAVREMLKYYHRQRVRFRAAVARPACDLQWQHTQGIMATVAVVDNIRAGIRLELLTIAELLEQNRPGDAMEALECAFRASGFLANEPHLIPRQEAARARAEALQVVQAIAQHPAANKVVHGHLYDLLSKQLVTWPADRLAWIGERAEGLHTYELVRNGHLLTVLDEAELVQLRESKDFKATVRQIREAIDEDELFYLNAMRQIIEECEQPYFERVTRFAELRAKIEQAASESTHPFVAIHALLKDFEKGQLLQAKDRALCEAWALVLAMAAGQPLPDIPVNGLTGAPYRLLQQKERAVIAGILPGTDDATIIVPMRSPL